MSWAPDDELAERAITDELLAADKVDAEARRGWRRRAVGMPRRDALAQVPRVGTVQCQLPIDGWRHLHLHIEASGLNAARWMRRALVERFLAEGGDPDQAAAMLAMREEQRPADRKQRFDPLDHGQSRRRVGRNGHGWADADR